MTWPTGYRTAYARQAASYQKLPSAHAYARPGAVAAVRPYIPGLPRIPSPGRWGIPVVGAAVVGKLAYDYFMAGETPIGSSDGITIPDGSGWVHCWTCEDGDPITHQWAFNSGLHDCPPSTAGCLAGQGLEGVMTELGTPIPAWFGEYYWLSDSPVNPAESAMKIVAGFVRPAEGSNGDVPMPGSAGAWVGVPAGVGDGPIDKGRELTYRNVTRPYSETRTNEVTDWPQSGIWGPGRIPSWVQWGAGALPSRIGRTAVVTCTKGDVVTLSVVTPREDAQARPRPPARGEKEKKFRITAARTIGRILNFATEASDMIDALHDAIDKECMRERPELRKHTNRIYVSERYVKRFLKQSKTPQAKMRDIVQFFDCLDGVQALKNIAKNEVEDRLFGKGGQLLKKARQKAVDAGYIHDRPGWQVGPWDTITRDMKPMSHISKSDVHRIERGAF